MYDTFEGRATLDLGFEFWAYGVQSRRVSPSFLIQKGVPRPKPFLEQLFFQLVLVSPGIEAVVEAEL